jgi:nicotinate-nucleotide--dimethylbenzimidazole phosphoribosyltransferase
MHLIKTAISEIIPIDQASMRSASIRLDQLTKPAGSLGRLEELAVQLAGISRACCPCYPHKTVVVMAADHGVANEGVSAFPQEVTPQMVINFLRGGAAINVLSRRAGAKVLVVDMGVIGELPDHPNLYQACIAPGTHSIASGPAMTHNEAILALETGISIAHNLVQDGIDLFGTGDMGIANTTPSSAIISVFTGLPVEKVTGKGTGIDDAGLEHKIKIIKQALQVNSPNPDDPIDVLMKVGGFEIGGIAGLILGAASKQKPIIIDGFISGAAALIAVKLCPEVKNYMIAAHNSVEGGHRHALSAMGLHPLLDLGFRLGEGTGAAIAMQLVDSACAIRDEMATFTEAGVSEKDELSEK